MTIFDEPGNEFIRDAEIYFEQQGILRSNGSKISGSGTTREEDYVWNLYAALLDGERVSLALATSAKEIMARTKSEKSKLC